MALIPPSRTIGHNTACARSGAAQPPGVNLNPPGWRISCWASMARNAPSRASTSAVGRRLFRYRCPHIHITVVTSQKLA